MNNTTPIPLFYPVHSADMEQAAVDVLRSGQIATGPAIEHFEQAFGTLIERPHVVSTNDMTNALVLALRLAGVRPGDQVATLAFSCLSTNAAIAMVGAHPVWIDLDPSSMSMDVADLSQKITGEIKALLLYYVAGYPAATKEIAALCAQYQVCLIEDCNNALGARIQGRPIGQSGNFSVYSFYPNRQINALEGGALVCANPEHALLAKKLRRFGVDYAHFRDSRGEISAESDVPDIGISAAFNQLHAAVALVQIPSFATRQNAVRAHAALLTSLLTDVPSISVVTPVHNSESACWGFFILAKERDWLLLELKRHGIMCSIMHQRNDLYSGFARNQCALPGTTDVMQRVLALPCGWWLNRAQIEHIADTIQRLARSIPA